MLNRGCLISVFFLLALMGCNTPLTNSLGGTEAGNPPVATQREVQGRVPAGSSTSGSALSALSLALTSNCVADTVVATHSEKELVTQAVADDCSFRVLLEVGKAYHITFTLKGVFVGSLLFTSKDPLAFPIPVLIPDVGETSINLGVLTLKEHTFNPEKEPEGKNSQDSSGAAGQPDHTSGTPVVGGQVDSNFNGVPDNQETTPTTADQPPPVNNQPINQPTEKPTDAGQILATVLEVLPRNGAGLNKIISAATLDSVVKARFNCEIDPQTINPTNFKVTDLLGNGISCQYVVSAPDQVVTCQHANTLFLPLMTYTATLSDVHCVDGRVIPKTSWSWMTFGLDLF